MDNRFHKAWVYEYHCANATLKVALRLPAGHLREVHKATARLMLYHCQIYRGIPADQAWAAVRP